MPRRQPAPTILAEQRSTEGFEFDRTASRLIEMRRANSARRISMPDAPSNNLMPQKHYVREFYDQTD